MKLPFRTKLSYGIGGICDETLYSLTGTYLLLFLTTVVGLNPVVAGALSALGTVWEAVCGPIIGFKSDATQSRYGRRKPFLLIAAIPVALVTTLLFTTIDAGPVLTSVYYGVMILLFWTVFATVYVPYIAWGSDLTDDYNERTVLRSYSYMFYLIGMTIGMVMPSIIVDFFTGLNWSVERSWQMVGLLAGLAACGGLLICTLTIHNDDDPNFVKPEKTEPFLSKALITGIFKEYVEILKLKPIRYLIGASIVYLISNTVFSSGRVFYMTYNMQMDEKMISAMMLLIILCSVVYTPLVVKIAAKTDKKFMFMYGIGLSGVLMIVSRFVGVTSMPMMVAVCLIYALANTCYWQLMSSMIYDVCEVEELISGENRSGGVISLQALSESLSIAFGLQGLGIILDMSGFVNDALVQPESALVWTSHSFTLIPGICMLLVFFLMTRYPISKANFERVRDALDRRKAGEDIDIKEFEDLFE